MLIGLWAWTEKDIFNNFSRITNIALDPAFILIVGGCLAFTIGFTGCVGALRENTCLLAGVRIYYHIHNQPINLCSFIVRNIFGNFTAIGNDNWNIGVHFQGLG